VHYQPGVRNEWQATRISGLAKDAGTPLAALGQVQIVAER